MHEDFEVRVKSSILYLNSAIFKVPMQQNFTATFYGLSI